MRDYCTAATILHAFKGCRAYFTALTRVNATCRMKDNINSLRLPKYISILSIHFKSLALSLVFKMFLVHAHFFVKCRKKNLSHLKYIAKNRFLKISLCRIFCINAKANLYIVGDVVICPPERILFEYLGQFSALFIIMWHPTTLLMGPPLFY